jgi:hypothetical protein
MVGAALTYSGSPASGAWKYSTGIERVAQPRPGFCPLIGVLMAKNCLPRMLARLAGSGAVWTAISGFFQERDET